MFEKIGGRVTNRLNNLQINHNIFFTGNNTEVNNHLPFNCRWENAIDVTP